MTSRMMDHHQSPQPSAACSMPAPVGPPGIVSDIAPVMARSNPYNDLRPFIELMWCTRENMCKNIFIDDFPRGTRDAPATKDEEDKFLLTHFDKTTLQVQGGRFLKQALYAIATHNQDQVTAFARDWAKKHEDYYSDASMVRDMCNPNKQPRTFFELKECEGREDKFLRCAIRVIRQNILAADETEANNTAKSSPSTVKLSPKSVSEQDSDVTEAALPSPVAQRASSSKMYATVPRVFSGELTHAPPLSAPLSNIPSEWGMISAAPQTNPNFKRRSQNTSRGGRDFSSGTQSHVGAATYGAPKGLQTVMIQPGPQTRAMQMDATMASPFFSNQSAYGGFGVTEPAQAYPGFSHAWTEKAGNVAHGSAGQDFYYLRDDPRHASRGRGNYRGGYQDRPARPAYNAANMDPDSFSRLTNDRSTRGHTGHRVRRASGAHSSGHRHVSMFDSNNRFQTQRDPAGRRFFSDQHQTQQPFRYPSSSLAPEGDARDHASAVMAWGGDPYGHFYPSSTSTSYSTGVQQATLYEGANEFAIPTDRNDIDRLSIFNVPKHVRPDHVRELLSRYATVRKVTIDESGLGEYVVWFASADDARRVLAINNFTIGDFHFFLHVPGIFLYHTTPASVRPVQRQSKGARGGHGNGKSWQWSTPHAQPPVDPALPASLNGTNDMASAYISVRNDPYNGNSADTAHFAGSGNSHAYMPRHGYEGDRNLELDSAIPASSNGTAMSKKQYKKRHSNRKTGKFDNVDRVEDPDPRRHKKAESVSSTMTAVTVVRRTSHITPETSSAHEPLEDAKSSEQDTGKTLIKPLDLVESVKSYAMVTRAALEAVISDKSGLEIPRDATTPATASLPSFPSPSLDVEDAPERPDEDDKGTPKSPDLRDDSIVFDSDLASGSPCAKPHEGTSPRSEPAMKSPGTDASPKASDDIEDSFQTAAETPESARSVRAMSTSLGAYLPSHSVTAPVTKESDDQVALSQPNDDPPVAAVTEVQDVTMADKHELEPIKKMTSTETSESTAPAVSTITSEALAKAKRLQDIKTGPRQTESLSPFAMLKKESKKKPKVFSRKARKTGIGETFKTHSRAVSAASSSDVRLDALSETAVSKEAETLSLSSGGVLGTAPEPSQTGSQTVSEPPVQEQPLPVSPKKWSLKGLLGPYMGGKSEKGKTNVGREVEPPVAETPFDDDTKSEKDDLHPTHRDTEHVAVLGPLEPAREEQSQPSRLNIVFDQMHLDRPSQGQHANGSSENLDTASSTRLSGTVPPHLMALQEPAVITAKRPRKPSRKRKGGKKNSSVSKVDTERSGRSSVVEDDDASSSATLQGHTPAESRSGSVEANERSLSKVDGDSASSTYTAEQRSMREEFFPYLEMISMSYLDRQRKPNATIAQEQEASRFTDVTDGVPTISTKEETPDPEQPESKELLMSKHKMKELAHREKLAKYNAKQQWESVKQELLTWADEEQIHAAALRAAHDRECSSLK